MNNDNLKLIILSLFFGFIVYHLFFINYNQVYAFDFSTPNNKFGIHLAQPHLEDLKISYELINSNGGDWGYVTLVIQENDRDRNKWQEIFDRMRELHLIPIIRLATIPQADKWRRPNKEDVDGWVSFLDSLHWVIKDRYVILFNEPNHGSEWGGEVDAQNYAQVALVFAQKLKEKSPDFFITLAGLDASAPSSLPNFQDEAVFLGQFFNYVTIEQFNNLFSGLASHSYPNPAFSGSPYDIGRGSIRTYEWELNQLSQFGVKELPVFITETGWQHNQYQISKIKNQKLTPEKVAEYFKAAFEQIWLSDDRIAAVTPFVLDYQGEPFLNFSWKKFQNNDYYPQFYTVQSLYKVKGGPVQIEKGEIIIDFPKELVSHSNYHFILKLRNVGQAVWDREHGYRLSVVSLEPELARFRVNNQEEPFEYFFSDLKNIKPFEETDIDLYIKTNGSLGKKNMQIILEKDGGQILEEKDWLFEVFNLPSLSFKISLFPKLISSGDSFEIQVFNENEEIVFKKKGIKVSRGKGVLEEVKNIALERKYRVVILNPYYLPRQGFVSFQKGVNELKFETMLPLDFYPDGKLDLEDFWTLLKEPKSFILLLP